jgi:hypothetical protein
VTVNIPDQIASIGDRLAARFADAWRSFSSWAILVVGIVLVLIGADMLRIATQPAVAVDTAALLTFGGGGLATAIAGVLLVLRQRIEAAERILTVLAGSTFAIALAFLPDQPKPGESMLTFAVLFAGAFAATVLFAPGESRDVGGSVSVPGN